MIYIGIDLSLTNSGVVVWESQTQKWSGFAFLERIRKHKSFSHPDITLWPPIPKGSNEVRYTFVVDSILTLIKSYQAKGDSIIPILEDYAYGCSTGFTYKLHELGGIFKSRLLLECGLQAILMAPTRWKKFCTGHAHASKGEVIEYFKNHPPYWDLMNVFQLDKSPTGEYPHPVQDIADACGIIEGYKKTLEPIVKNKPKRKVSLSCGRKKKIQHTNVKDNYTSECDQSKGTYSDPIQFDFTVLFDNIRE
jgi:hypothetical protein